MEPSTLIIEGKTKRVWATDDPHAVIFEMKDALSAGDGARKDAVDGIGAVKAAQISNMFTYLASKGVKTALREKLGETKLLCERCDMIPLELVVRRFAWGSALQRTPQLKNADGTPPRLKFLVNEVFVKDSVVVYPDGRAELMKEPQAVKLRDAGEAEVFTDPYVVRTKDGKWNLHNAHAELTEAPLITIDPIIPNEELDKIFAEIVTPSFLALEEAWAKQNITIADFKVEVGRASRDGSLVLADELNSDSMRLWPNGDPKAQLDKQGYREGESTQAQLEKYKLVAELTAKM